MKVIIAQRRNSLLKGRNIIASIAERNSLTHAIFRSILVRNIRKVFIKVLTSNIGVERKTVTNAGIAVRVPGRYPIWFLLLARIHLKRVGIDRGDMKKENKNILEQIVVRIVSTLLVIGLFYYVLFHGFIHDWIIKIEKIIQLIIN